MTERQKLRKVISGEDKTYGLNFSEEGSAKDVSGWSFEMQIFQDNGRDVEVGSTDIDTSNAASGEIVINLSASRTDQLQEGDHEYRINAVKPNGKIDTLLYGILPVEVVG